jgi:hypothetical protein
VGFKQTESQTLRSDENLKRDGSLLPEAELSRFKSQWDGIQSAFVDDPRRAVEQADRLVEAVLQRMTQAFTEERARFQDQLRSGKQMETEELRHALRHYRTLLTRLL